jgi:hypothetical protein
MRSRRVNDSRIACVAPSLAVRSGLRQQGSHRASCGDAVRTLSARSQQLVASSQQLGSYFTRSSDHRSPNSVFSEARLWGMLPPRH